MRTNEILRKYLTDRGIKQTYVAEKTGYSEDMISKILGGKRRMTADELLTICEKLHINIEIFRSPVNELAG